jgi:hypothetical protein
VKESTTGKETQIQCLKVEGSQFNDSDVIKKSASTTAVSGHKQARFADS